MNDLKKLLGFLAVDRSWKAYAVVSGIAFGLLLVVSSILFALFVALLKLSLLVLGIAAGAKALWLAWPTIEAKMKTSKI